MESSQSTLRRAAQNIERLIAERASKLQLTPNMLRVTMLIDENPGLWAAQIEREHGFGKRSLQYILRALSNRKLIKRGTGENHWGNWKAITLTAKGSKAAAAGRRIDAAIEAAIEAVVREEIGGGVETFQAKLKRLANLNGGETP